MTNIIGYNFRLTEMQAAIGVDQVLEMKKLNNIRKKLDFLINEIKILAIYLRHKKLQIHIIMHISFRYVKLKKKTF